MKIRTDFVTNSSSSSFVISYTNKAPSEELLKIINAKATMDLDGVANVAELKEYIMDIYGDSEKDTWEKVLAKGDYVNYIYDKYKQRLSEGYNLLFLNIDWDETETIKTVKSLRGIPSIIVDEED